jgi:hypothetical protein
VDYATETSFTEIYCSVVATLGSGGQGVFLPKHMDGDLVYGLKTISWQILLFSFGCVHPSYAEVKKIVRGICISSM